MPTRCRRGIRERVLAIIQPGDALWRCPRRTALEWWLISAEGKLIDAFWEED